MDDVIFYVFAFLMFASLLYYALRFLLYIYFSLAKTDKKIANRYKNNAHYIFLITLSIFAIPLICFSTINLLYTNTDLWIRGIRTTGEIIKVVRPQGCQPFHPTPCLRILTVQYTDQSSRIASTTVYEVVQFHSQVGDTISFYYDPTKPSRTSTTSVFYEFFLPGLLVIVILLCGYKGITWCIRKLKRLTK